MIKVIRDLEREVSQTWRRPHDPYLIIPNPTKTPDINIDILLSVFKT